jgi:hypothetical protein
MGAVFTRPRSLWAWLTNGQLPDWGKDFESHWMTLISEFINQLGAFVIRGGHGFWTASCVAWSPISLQYGGQQWKVNLHPGWMPHIPTLNSAILYHQGVWGAGHTGNLLDDTQLKGPSLAAQKELVNEWQVHVPSNLRATGWPQSVQYDTSTSISVFCGFCLFLGGMGSGSSLQGHESSCQFLGNS